MRPHPFFWGRRGSPGRAQPAARPPESQGQGPGWGTGSGTHQALRSLPGPLSPPIYVSGQGQGPGREADKPNPGLAAAAHWSQPCGTQSSRIIPVPGAGQIEWANRRLRGGHQARDQGSDGTGDWGGGVVAGLQVPRIGVLCTHPSWWWWCWEGCVPHCPLCPWSRGVEGLKQETAAGQGPLGLLPSGGVLPHSPLDSREITLPPPCLSSPEAAVFPPTRCGLFCPNRSADLSAGSLRPPKPLTQGACGARK